jgi:beta-phosphoglucomutase-like phosphatase (HAD superfamily)
MTLPRTVLNMLIKTTSKVMCFQQTSYMQALDVLVTFDDISHPKPAPDRNLLACQKLSVSPSRVLVFEDSNIGIKASLAAGCQTVAIPDIVEIELALLALCHHRFSSFDELYPLLA